MQLPLPLRRALRRPDALPVQDSRLLRRKLGHWFDCLDGDRDGRLTRHDFEAAAERTADRFRVHGDSRDGRLLHQRFSALWSAAGLGAGAAVDREAFTEQLIVSLRDRRRALHAVNALACILADLADLDGDGEVTEDEYIGLLAAAFHLRSTPDLRLSFERLDRNHNGVLEHDEIHQAVVEYFSSSDPEARGNWLLGPAPLRPSA
ncbi:EF-hand domain-containing protein [Streptomyces sp. A7024]|uniref:EF-hand domain-containing protein n=1 Tax=Streptomyces coryli TaxID=1128680 RepID=A0A6G4TZS3_9ACTN|nr:EF-hand domain-containing protein [Streptomyces coryli]NGN64956.1 EF-hand domain-containing protein [Streptomyces coryli]